MIRPNVADTIALTLQAHGVRHGFGMPGGEVVTMIDALVTAGIQFHLARHETAAAIMAAGVSVLEDVPGLLVTTVGPGLTNAVNGIADASQERVPLLVISGIVDRPTRARYTHQVIDHAAVLRPFVKASFEVEAESAAATVTRALALAMQHPRGPVHLDLSPATAALPALDQPSGPVPVSLPSLCADDPALRNLAARLSAAERPLIIAGFEAACLGADVAGLGVPVFTTYKAKGIIPEDHPLAMGGIGLSPAADKIALDLIARSDLVLAIGYDPIEMRLGWLDPSDRLVEVTGAPADHAMHGASLRFLACPAEVCALLPGLITPRPQWQDMAAETRQALRTKFETPKPWGPHAIIETLNTVSPETVVTVDSGAHRILLSQKWQAMQPLTLLQSAGFCTMAAALPLAIGAATATGQRTIAVMGDGGLEMCAGELATLRDLGLPVTVIVFQDQSLALIAMKQAQAGLPSGAVTLGLTDFAALARAFGGAGVTVSDARTLAQELADARDRAGFTLIACRFDADDYRNSF